METTDDFLEHYGVKGMKWGRRTGGADGGGGGVKAARKEVRKELRGEAKTKFKNYHKINTAGGKKGRVGVGRTVGSALLFTNTFGASTSAQIARSAGFSKGSSVAIGIIGGPFGGVAARELKIRNAARREVG